MGSSDHRLLYCSNETVTCQGACWFFVLSRPLRREFHSIKVSVKKMLDEMFYRRAMLND